jgi:hypothetical protein
MASKHSGAHLINYKKSTAVPFMTPVQRFDWGALIGPYVYDKARAHEFVDATNPRATAAIVALARSDAGIPNPAGNPHPIWYDNTASNDINFEICVKAYTFAAREWLLLRAGRKEASVATCLKWLRVVHDNEWRVRNDPLPLYLATSHLLSLAEALVFYARIESPLNTQQWGIVTQCVGVNDLADKALSRVCRTKVLQRALQHILDALTAGTPDPSLVCFACFEARVPFPPPPELTTLLYCIRQAGTTPPLRADSHLCIQATPLIPISLTAEGQPWHQSTPKCTFDSLNIVPLPGLSSQVNIT